MSQKETCKCFRCGQTDSSEDYHVPPGSLAIRWPYVCGQCADDLAAQETASGMTLASWELMGKDLAR